MNVENYVDLVRLHLPQLEIHSVESITSGWDFFLLEVNQDLLFRFPRNTQAESNLDTEIELFKELASTLPVQIPEYRYDFRVQRHSFGRFVGYDKIPGEPLEPGLVKEAPKETACQLGDFLSALHRFPVSQAKKIGVAGGDVKAWRQEYVEFYDWIQENALHLLEPSHRDKAKKLWEGFLAEDANFKFQSVLVHEDLLPQHILYDSAQKQITGVIDWTDAVINDPAIDFAFLVEGFADEFMDLVIDVYAGEVDDTFKRRAVFYSTIVPFYGIRHGVMWGVDEYVQEGLAQIPGRFSGP